MTIDKPRTISPRDCTHDWQLRDYEPDFDHITTTHYCPVCSTEEQTTLTPTQATQEELDELKQREHDPNDPVEHVGLRVDDESDLVFELTAYIRIAYVDETEETLDEPHHFTPK